MHRCIGLGGGACRTVAMLRLAPTPELEVALDEETDQDQDADREAKDIK